MIATEGCPLLYKPRDSRRPSVRPTDRHAAWHPVTLGVTLPGGLDNDHRWHKVIVFLGVSQHAESDFDVRFTWGDRYIRHTAFMPSHRAWQGATQRDMVSHRFKRQASVAYRLPKASYLLLFLKYSMKWKLTWRQGNHSIAHRNPRNNGQTNKPKPKENVNLFVENINGQNTKSVVDLKSSGRTESSKGTFCHFGKNQVHWITSIFWIQIGNVPYIDSIFRKESSQENVHENQL